MSSDGSKESMVSSSIDLNIKNIYACGSRSLFITYDNRIYIGQKSFTMNPLSSYAFLCQVEKQIKLLELGEEHCLILDSKLYNKIIYLLLYLFKLMVMYMG